ncbi:xylose repressor [Actinomycetota bacterium]|nr:xylose repressor [Actinomycetota bacterium]
MVEQRSPGPGQVVVPRVLAAAEARERNLSLVLRQVLDAEQPVSRAEIADATGLARASVSGLVEQLVDGGLVTELAPRQARRVGRPSVPLIPSQGSVVGIGLEVNIDYLGVRAVDLGGRVVADHLESGDFRDADPVPVLRRLATRAEAMVARLHTEGVRVAGAVLALPGLVDRGSGLLRHASKLGWRNVDALALIGGTPGVDGLAPRAANEADLGARAEVWTRRHSDWESFVYISGEVGIGAAIVLDREVYPGRHGWSGEIGHTIVRPDAGGRGVSLEDIASQDALMEAAGLSPYEPLERLLEAAEHRDERALAALRACAEALGVAIGNVISIVDVDRVVLGGAYCQLFPYMGDVVEAELRRRVLFARWAPVEVASAEAGLYAAMTGGALAALEPVTSAPAAWLAGRA